MPARFWPSIEWPRGEGSASLSLEGAVSRMGDEGCGSGFGAGFGACEDLGVKKLEIDCCLVFCEALGAD